MTTTGDIVTPTGSSVLDQNAICALYSPDVTRNLDVVADWALPALLANLAALPGLSDTALINKTADAIMAAVVSSGYDDRDVLASACYEESLRRQQTAGHHSNCGSGVYAQAYASAVRSQGHFSESVVCGCDRIRAAGIPDVLAGKLPARS